MTLRFVPFSSLAFTAALVAFVACKPAIIANGIGTGGGATGGSGGGGDFCNYQGTLHPVGSTFPALDGCNTCTCEANGAIPCTDIACATDGGPGVCVFQGATYAAGQQFPALDGCNTCTCLPNGTVVCTEIACDAGPPPPVDAGPGVCFYYGSEYAAGQDFPAINGCDTCTCLPDGSVACTSLQCPVDAGPPPPSDGGPGVCFYDGYEYVAGQVFPAIDGCNTCSCGPDGTVACTANVCDGGAPPPLDAGLCLYDGVSYAPGQEFPAADGCNTCACTDSGAVLCTTYPCAVDAGPIPF